MTCPATRGADRAGRAACGRVCRGRMRGPAARGAGDARSQDQQLRAAAGSRHGSSPGRPPLR
eukprot:6477930-Pyramimonas_sp.AAC.1